MVPIGGTIAATPMGDANASIPTPEPFHCRPMFGAFGGAVAASSASFVSPAAQAAGLGRRLGLAKRTIAVDGARNVTKKETSPRKTWC